MRADWRDRDDPGSRRDDGAARRQRVGGRAGGGADHQTVAAVHGQHFAVHLDLDADHPGRAAAADHDVVHGLELKFTPAVLPLGGKQGARLDREFPGGHRLDCLGQILPRGGGKETHAADVHAKNRCAGAGCIARPMEHRAVAPEHHDQVGQAAEFRRVFSGRELELGQTRSVVVCDRRQPGGHGQFDGALHNALRCRLVGLGHEGDFSDPLLHFFNSTRNSLLPAGPVSGDAVPATHSSGVSSSTNVRNSSSTRWWISGSRITPCPLSTSALPASN